MKASSEFPPSMNPNAFQKCKQCAYPAAVDDFFCGRCGTRLLGAEHLQMQVQSIVSTELPILLKSHLKDSTFVELEVFDRIAERSLRWLKNVGVILAVPVAVLGAIGIKSYIDLTSVGHEISALQKQSSDLATQVQKREAQLKDLNGRVTVQVAALESAASAVRSTTAKAGTLTTDLNKIGISIVELREAVARGQSLNQRSLQELNARVDRVEKEIKAPRYKSFSDAVDILARTIYGEGRGHSRAVREAIAAVVAHRVNTASERGRTYYGETVEEVCMKRAQFGTWSDADMTAQAKSATLSDPIFAESRDIAERLLTGRLTDPIRGAMFYVHDIGRLPMWAQGKTPIVRIDRFLFYTGESVQ